MNALGPDNAFWIDGEWISWDDIPDEPEDDNSHLARLEHEAELRFLYPNADIKLIPIFRDLLGLAKEYHHKTGRHLQVYGDIGELYGAITFGIKLHRNYAQGSDGRIGNDFIEVKTITPFKKNDRVAVRLDRHFNKLLIVKISTDFSVSGRLADRRKLPKPQCGTLHLTWDQVSSFE